MVTSTTSTSSGGETVASSGESQFLRDQYAKSQKQGGR